MSRIKRRLGVHHVVVAKKNWNVDIRWNQWFLWWVVSHYHGWGGSFSFISFFSPSSFKRHYQLMIVVRATLGDSAITLSYHECLSTGFQIFSFPIKQHWTKGSPTQFFEQIPCWISTAKLKKWLIFFYLHSWAEPGFSFIWYSLINSLE